MSLLSLYPQIGWTGDNTPTGDPREPVRPPVPEMQWRDCPTCWGQGRLYSMNLRDYADCWTCLGVGQVGKLA